MSKNWSHYPFLSKESRKYCNIDYQMDSANLFPALHSLVWKQHDAYFVLTNNNDNKPFAQNALCAYWGFTEPESKRQPQSFHSTINRTKKSFSKRYFRAEKVNYIYVFHSGRTCYYFSYLLEMIIMIFITGGKPEELDSHP